MGKKGRKKDEINVAPKNWKNKEKKDKKKPKSNILK